MSKDILRQDEEIILLGDLQDDIITAEESQLSSFDIIDNDLANTNSDDEILDSNIVKPKPRVTTLDDIDDIIDDEKISDSDRIKQIMEKTVNMPPCFLNKKLDEKLKNIMTGVTIPFVLISIGFSLFNIGKIRHALSFLFLSLGLGAMGIFYTLRYRNIIKCTCPVCKTQSRNIIQFAILWGILAVGLLGVFIYFAIVG